MAAPALAMVAAEEASGSSFDALSAKMNVLGHIPLILSQGAAHPLAVVTQISESSYRRSWTAVHIAYVAADFRTPE